MGERILRLQGLKDRQYGAHPHQQRHTALGKRFAQFCKASQAGFHMAGIALGTLQPFRLDDKNADGGVQALGSKQRRVVVHPQITFKPHQRARFHHAPDSTKRADSALSAGALTFKQRASRVTSCALASAAQKLPGHKDVLFHRAANACAVAPFQRAHQIGVGII